MIPEIHWEHLFLNRQNVMSVKTMVLMLATVVALKELWAPGDARKVYNSVQEHFRPAFLIIFWGASCSIPFFRPEVVDPLLLTLSMQKAAEMSDEYPWLKLKQMFEFLMSIFSMEKSWRRRRTGHFRIPSSIRSPFVLMEGMRTKGRSVKRWRSRCWICQCNKWVGKVLQVSRWSVPLAWLFRCISAFESIVPRVCDTPSSYCWCQGRRIIQYVVSGIVGVPALLEVWKVPSGYSAANDGGGDSQKFSICNTWTCAACWSWVEGLSRIEVSHELTSEGTDLKEAVDFGHRTSLGCNFALYDPDAGMV